MIMDYFSFGFSFLFFCFIFFPVFTLFIQRWHFLMVLLCLELVMLGFYSFLSFFDSFYSGVGFFPLCLLVFSACEASVGLSMLVSLIRSHGKDFISILGGLKC